MAYEVKLMGEQNPIVLSNEDGLKVITLYEDKTVLKDTNSNVGDVNRTNKGKKRSMKKREKKEI